MGSADRPSIPFKGTLFATAIVCAGLYRAGQVAEDFVEEQPEVATALRAQLRGQAPSSADSHAEEQLLASLGIEDPAGAFSGVLPEELRGALGRGAAANDGASTGGSHPRSVEAVRAARPEGWVYPAFDQPAEGLHGAPAMDLPRNVRFTLVDELGEPLTVDRVDVWQHTVSGPVHRSAFQSSDFSAGWTLGLPGLMTGTSAGFKVVATRGGMRYEGSLGLDRIPQQVELNGALVRLSRASDFGRLGQRR